jgi:hypothetical protein
MARRGTSAERRKKKSDVLELYDPDPARPLAVARAQPDIVGVREPDFEAAMRS